MYRILVVDDDMEINQMLVKLLKKKQYHTTAAYSGTEAMLLMEKENFDLVILDLMLPGISGEKVLGLIMENKKLPVIAVSAKDDIQSKIELLRNGADDYITKPFDTEELLARIEVVLRRTYHNDSDRINTLRCGDLFLEPATMKVTLKETEIKLTKSEFTILKTLMEHPKQVFTKEMLYEKVWNEAFEGTENTINVHISNLRKKLASFDDSRTYIKTVWGMGFKIED